MGIEIERKFLVSSDNWRAQASGPGTKFRQGYLIAEKGRTVRVRMEGEEGRLTIKGPVIGISRAEFEYPIPLKDAMELLDQLCVGNQVEKIRHLVPAGDLVYEVDEFLGDNAGLIIAEIELPSPDATFLRPPWLGREVTGDHRYYNSHLSRHPFQTWDS